MKARLDGSPYVLSSVRVIFYCWTSLGGIQFFVDVAVADAVAVSVVSAAVTHVTDVTTVTAVTAVTVLTTVVVVAAAAAAGGGGGGGRGTA